MQVTMTPEHNSAPSDGDIAKKVLRVFAIWAICSFVTAGTLCRQMQADWSFCSMATEYYRQNLAFSIGMSMLPQAWLMAPFVSGFYEYGWGFSPYQRKGCWTK